jgi:hypothetical protein
MSARRDHYESFRRAHGLWAVDGVFYHGVYADSPTACDPTAIAAGFVGWIAGTEYADDTDWWRTEALTDVESIDFMQRDGFVLYGEPDGEAAHQAAQARMSR